MRLLYRVAFYLLAGVWCLLAVVLAFVGIAIIYAFLSWAHLIWPLLIGCCAYSLWRSWA